VPASRSMTWISHKGEVGAALAFPRRPALAAVRKALSRLVRQIATNAGEGGALVVG